ncbi:pyruvate, water dikinase regulatory protein [Clostridium botulinum]|uniref:Putative pyruvate, phosphate dikinase regulatory protein n=11 Tax=Clostridium botulinum TaxID=1491 RepID=PDRP_CLOBH|nr:pyruvate, water dikinase regulatory protein [Clostridium botulinum]A5I7Y4.1 RecName: Full=Putative pyruvate, phosphate dikinase regulatory protein; Short=PPDK regulatory protein [Clostridium botulinum A str. Hall]A7FZF4.1 RecName: Full=Putative pyruvate, phosphate dikinase regulatory protein; Short=PPDK regulatory protein [Clostridium botulinum A str. ATCC 19397]A7GJK7.1 RecName: Full=Putative pyruvate, phosphate dikinase regulatory protein; Short=PPDK regulatory protein [Clostridium botulinu
MFKIYAVSDSIGETAEQVANATAYQFGSSVKVERVPYVKTFEDVNNLISIIKNPNEAMIISTIVLVDIREFLVQRCVESGIHISNVLGPCISLVSTILNKTPEYKPGAVWDMDKKYYKKIEAMEFAIRYDDSKDHSGIKHADIVLIGLSRTSKTPLSIYLANKGIKALNIPLMPEVPVPEELFEIDRKKIIGLTIDPMHLIEIRRHRVDNMMKIPTELKYANAERVLDELEFADKIMRKLKCKVIDVTKRAIEDTALIIMESVFSDRII